MTPDEILDAVVKWVETCEENGRDINPINTRKSALLRRLLSGKPALEVPPPKAFSYPRYEMVEEKECQIHDIWEREDDHIYYQDKKIPIQGGTILVIDQCPHYIWEDEDKKIVQHVPSGRRWEYFEKETYPIAVAVGEPKDHPYQGKFLRRLPDRYTLRRSFFMGAGSENEDVKDFGTIERVKEYIRWNAVDCEWSYILRDNSLGREIVWNDPTWEKDFGLYRFNGFYLSKEEYDARLQER